MTQHIQRRLVFQQETETVHLKIHAEVTTTGDLVLTGHDFAKGPTAVAGDADLEYQVRVPSKEKDRLLLDLMAHTFNAATSASDFKTWLKQRGVPHTFETW